MSGFGCVERRKQRAQDVRRRRAEEQRQAERSADLARRQEQRRRVHEAQQRVFYDQAAPSVERPYRYAANISREMYDYQSTEYTREQVDKLMASPEYATFRRRKCWDWVKWQTLLILCAFLAGLWIAFTYLNEDPEAMSNEAPNGQPASG